MKKIFILSVLVLIGVRGFAQEASVSADSTEDSTEEVAAAPAAEPPVEHWASCDETYLNYVRGLPAAQQKKEMDNWWMLADRDYFTVKNDEFQYKEAKPKKEKEFAALLGEKPGLQSVLLDVKFGSYDFKKKGFPLMVALNSADKTFENQSSGAYYSTPMFGGPPSAYISSCTMAIMDQKTTDRMPSKVVFKPVNVAQLKFLKMDEAQAKKLTASLGNSRVKTVTVRLYPAKTAFVKKSLGVFKLNQLVVSSEVREFELSAGDDKLVVPF